MQTEPGEMDVELFREPLPRFRSVRLSLAADGSLTLGTQDMGPTVEAVWGDGDYEFSTRVPAGAVAALAFHLLVERFQNQPDATDALEAFCKARGIPCDWTSWA